MSKIKDEMLRCEHGLRRPCATCDPYMYSRWLEERKAGIR